jgi:hypothetical protein
MDKNVRYIVLIGAGGVGVYLLYKGGYLQKWLPSVFAPAKTPEVTGTTGATGGAPAGGAPAGGTATPPAAHTCAIDAQLCWDGTYRHRTGADCHFEACPPEPPAATGQTAAQIAANTATQAKRQLYDALVAQGVDPVTAQTYIDHCGTNGQCDTAYFNQMLQQAALGDPKMMRLTDVGGILYNADQWEFYRDAGGAANVDPGLVFADRTSPIHASEFVEGVNRFLTGGGMSGVGRIEYTPPRLRWLT